MPIRVAINGFGRIGRTTFKAGFDRARSLGIEFVAINDLTDPQTLAHLLKYDSVFREYGHKISYGKGYIGVDGKKILAFAVKDPKELPWKDLKIDVVLECTGIFRSMEKARSHLVAGAKKVIISAPAKGGDVPTYVLGVNAHKYKKSHKVINNASCTTNCIAPVANIINEKFGVRKAMMSTIHSYTADQRLVDAPHKDLRRARNACMSIIPTTTGAAIATTEAIPKLKGNFDGMAVRVPTPCVSLVDFTFLLKKKVTESQVNEAIKKACKEKRYKKIIRTTEKPLVSSDYIGDPYSSIVDLPLTKVVGGDLVKIIAWYDNEWGYSHRLIEMVPVVMGKK